MPKVAPRRGSRVAGAFAAAWLLAAAGAFPQTTGTAVVTAKRSFLWKVESRTTVAYLVGSIHVLTADYYPLSDAIERAFSSARILVEEINLGELDTLTAGALMLSKGIYTDGRTLDTVVSRETYTLVAERVRQTGLSIEVVRRMKPWMAALTVLSIELQKAGFDPNLGLDRYFFDKARKDGKPIKGLETAAYQFDRLDQMTPALQEQMLRSTLADVETQQREIQRLLAAWSSGEAATLERIVLAGFKEFPEVYERLVSERNRNWLPQIESCVQQSSPCFVVVGAAHLVGPDGLVAMLQRKGYKVEQQ